MLNMLLRRARDEFERLGLIPTNTGVALMAAGYIVPELEQQWAEQIGWNPQQEEA